jgi:small subunit ribosomal protein S8
MNMTDPIADMLTRIRNAVGSRHPRVELPASKLKVEIAKILQDEGFIAGFKMVDDSTGQSGGAIRLFLDSSASAVRDGASTPVATMCRRCSADLASTFSRRRGAS